MRTLSRRPARRGTVMPMMAFAGVSLKLALHKDATPRGGLAGVWQAPASVGPGR